MPSSISRFIPIKVCQFDFKVPGIIFHFSIESEDYTRVWNSLRKDITLVNYAKETPGQGHFAHITGGYDAGYYG
jgi:Zn-dependent oligopeptidase